MLNQSELKPRRTSPVERGDINLAWGSRLLVYCVIKGGGMKGKTQFCNTITVDRLTRYYKERKNCQEIATWGKKKILIVGENDY